MTFDNSSYESWLSSGKMTHELAGFLFNNFDDFMETSLSRVETLVDKGKHDSAFIEMIAIISFFNAGVSKQPSIIGKLKNWVNKLQSVTKKLAKSLKADTYTVSVGLPVGVSIGLSFPV